MCVKSYRGRRKSFKLGHTLSKDFLFDPTKVVLYLPCLPFFFHTVSDAIPRSNTEVVNDQIAGMIDELDSI